MSALVLDHSDQQFCPFKANMDQLAADSLTAYH